MQGIIYGQNYSNVVGTVYITKNGSTIKIRQEFLNEPTDYLLFDGSYTLKAQQHVFSEGALISKKIGLKNQICKSSISIYSEDTLGYWRGTITSLQCRNMNYDVICYASTLPFNEGKQNSYSNHWIQEFQKRLAKNYPSPKKMEEKRASFQLFTIYFDYDKFDIRLEYTARLNEMTMIVDSHTDYRIKITGHTDSDGSDAYNDVLSKNRAKAIKNYFLNKGIPEHKLVIDFKGEKFPVQSNQTKEGKQQNRRVIIGFM